MTTGTRQRKANPVGLRRNAQRRGRTALPRYGFGREGGLIADIEYPEGKPSWADALSRMAVSGEAMIVDLPEGQDAKETKLFRKRIRASINRTARRKMLRVGTIQTGTMKLLVWLRR